MLIAILSDTHDNVPAILAALRLLTPHKPNLYLHAGDITSSTTLDLFEGLPLHFVLGNSEYDPADIRRRAGELSLVCHGYCAKLALDGKRLGMCHGHDARVIGELAAAEFDYIIAGHSHEREDMRFGSPPNIRYINPGALFRTGSPSVALLDLAIDKLTFINVRA